MANLKDRAAIIKANQAVEEKCLEYEAALSKRTVEHAQACTDLAAIEGKISGNSDEIAQLEEQIGACESALADLKMWKHPVLRDDLG